MRCTVSPRTPTIGPCSRRSPARTPHSTAAPGPPWKRRLPTRWWPGWAWPPMAGCIGLDRDADVEAAVRAWTVATDLVAAMAPEGGEAPTVKACLLGPLSLGDGPLADEAGVARVRAADPGAPSRPVRPWSRSMSRGRSTPRPPRRGAGAGGVGLVGDARGRDRSRLARPAGRRRHGPRGGGARSRRRSRATWWTSSTARTTGAWSAGCRANVA